MRFLFKTDYAQDIRLARHGGHVFWYGLLCVALLAAPLLLPEYLLAQLTFVLIYGIVGLGLMLLAGFTGLFSIGHAAFFGVGAYAQAVLTGMGWPFPFALAAGTLLSAPCALAANGTKAQLASRAAARLPRHARIAEGRPSRFRGSMVMIGSPDAPENTGV